MKDKAIREEKDGEKRKEKKNNRNKQRKSKKESTKSVFIGNGKFLHVEGKFLYKNSMFLTVEPSGRFQRCSVSLLFRALVPKC